MILQEENRVVLGSEVRAVSELGRSPLLPDRPDDAVKIACVGEGTDLVDAAVRFFRADADGVAIARHALSDQLRAAVLAEGYTVVDIGGVERTTPVGAGARVAPGRISVVTSGSTGTPKLVAHTWASLYTAGSVTPETRRWLLTYQPGTYAWYQLLTLCMFTPAQELIVPGDDSDPEAILETGLAAEATAASATPTFWQYLIVKRREDLRRLPLRQITLGGEPVPQSVLDALRGLFPAARVSHIYASSEAGVGLVVHDGREGFPAAWLAPSRAAPRDAARPELLVEDGELFVRSPHAATGAGDWIATGDATVVRDDRILIVGRRGDDRLIVGGRKIGRERVEAAISSHPSVRWCRARTRATPTGAVVVADVIVDDSAVASPAERERQLMEHTKQAGVPEWAVPRLWRFLSEVPIERSRKAAR